ncbi:MAG: flavodoxin family protein [Alphaproteobacteria bacterium]|nr:flavodoxin family protein [Alphaproteobacteria bacterium]
MTFTITALNCTLKRDNSPSSTDLLLQQVLDEFKDFAGASGEIIRMSQLTIHPGVSSDEGDGDEWPKIRQKIVDSDVLLVGTPIWMGQPSSICKRVLERLDAFLGETDENGHFPSYGKCAAAVVVGNEDGAHHSSAEIFQALNDVGFTIAPNAVSYWVGEAMQGTDYKDLEHKPRTVTKATKMLVQNTAHLVGRMKNAPFPKMT